MGREPAGRDRRKPPGRKKSGGRQPERSGPRGPEVGARSAQAPAQGHRHGPRLGRQGERKGAPHTTGEQSRRATQHLHYHRHRRQCPRAGGWACVQRCLPGAGLSEPETEGPSGPPERGACTGTGRPAGLAQRSRVSLSRTWPALTASRGQPLLEELTFWKSTQCEDASQHMFGFDLHYKHSTASGRKAVINPDSMLKSRDILPTNAILAKLSSFSSNHMINWDYKGSDTRQILELWVWEKT